VALPAHLAERFSPALSRALRLGSVGSPLGAPPEGVAFGIPALDAVLPDGGFLRGGVVELAMGEGAPATSLALSACEALQRSHQSQGRALPWCAFVDPSNTLYAPGVIESGVRPERLLVVRPPLEALSRTLLKLAKSPAFELIVVDTIGVPGAHLRLALDNWPRLVRRLSLEVQGTERSIVLLTDRTLPRALPLPVAQRIDVTRPARDRLMVQVSKDRRGQITPLRPVAWSRSRLSQVSLPEESRHATAS
jgi:recombination protein RecA